MSLPFKCKRQNLDESGKPYDFSSDRYWNLEHHLLLHDRKEEDDYHELEELLLKPKYPGKAIHLNDDALIIHAWYPKSTVHTLLLPQSPRNRLSPFEAFQTAEFLALVQNEAAKLKESVGKELQRMYGKFSSQEKSREAVLNGEVELFEGEPLPKGRDWEKEVMVGVHAQSSISRLHIHVLSPDRFSTGIKNPKHYNSFTTPFFIDISSFPLPQIDIQDRGKFLESGLKCWKCPRYFGDDFIGLKEHLAVEFEIWKRE